MPAKVLDSFALIAYFRDELGAAAMEDMLVTAGKKDNPLLMTDVNYAEVKYSIVKKDGAQAWAEAAKVLQGLPVDFHSTTRALADLAIQCTSSKSSSQSRLAAEFNNCARVRK